jgi:hypothetical protein
LRAAERPRPFRMRGLVIAVGVAALIASQAPWERGAGPEARPSRPRLARDCRTDPGMGTQAGAGRQPLSRAAYLVRAVDDESGRSIPGAALRSRDGVRISGEMQAAPGVVGLSVVGDGSWTCVADGYRDEAIPESGSGTRLAPIVVRMRPVASLRIRVLGEAGRPVAGAACEVAPLADPTGGGAGTRSGTTDGEGVAVLSPLDPGMEATLTVSAPGHVTTTQRHAVRRGAHEIDVTLESGVRILASVPPATPPALLTVRLGSSNRRFEFTASSSKLDALGVTGEFVVGVVPAGTYEIGVWCDAATLWQAPAVEILGDYRLPLPPWEDSSHSVVVHAVDGDGQPVAAASVRTSRGLFVSGASGSVVVTPGKSDREFDVRAPGHLPSVASAISGAEVTVVLRRLASAWVHLRIPWLEPGTMVDLLCSEWDIRDMSPVIGPSLVAAMELRRTVALDGTGGATVELAPGRWRLLARWPEGEASCRMSLRPNAIHSWLLDGSRRVELGDAPAGAVTVACLEVQPDGSSSVLGQWPVRQAPRSVAGVERQGKLRVVHLPSADRPVDGESWILEMVAPAPAVLELFAAGSPDRGTSFVSVAEAAGVHRIQGPWSDWWWASGEGCSFRLNLAGPSRITPSMDFGQVPVPPVRNLSWVESWWIDSAERRVVWHSTSTERGASGGALTTLGSQGLHRVKIGGDHVLLCADPSSVAQRLMRVDADAARVEVGLPPESPIDGRVKVIQMSTEGIDMVRFGLPLPVLYDREPPADGPIAIRTFLPSDLMIVASVKGQQRTFKATVTRAGALPVVWEE